MLMPRVVSFVETSKIVYVYNSLKIYARQSVMVKKLFTQISNNPYNGVEFMEFHKLRKRNDYITCSIIGANYYTTLIQTSECSIREKT